MTFDVEALVDQASDLISACRWKGSMLATAESCTGGLIAAILTEVPGASNVFERGFVPYSNDAKTQQIGVPSALIVEHGAVSEAVALAMAAGALVHSRADLSVAVTGVAGPGGGTAEKPVGLVHLAAARRCGRVLHREIRIGDIGRRAIRLASVAEAFALVRALT